MQWETKRMIGGLSLSRCRRAACSGKLRRARGRRKIRRKAINGTRGEGVRANVIANGIAGLAGATQEVAPDVQLGRGRREAGLEGVELLGGVEGEERGSRVG